MTEASKVAVRKCACKLSQIEANQDRNNETVLDISQKLDEMSSELAQINEKTLTINQVQDMFGPMYEEIKGYLENISGGQITVGDLNAALEAHKTDLTRTNALIETLVNLVANLNTSGGGSGSSVDMSELTSLVSEIRTLIQNQQPPTAEQMQQLIDLIKDAQSLQGAQNWIERNGWNGKYGAYQKDVNGDTIPDIVVQRLDSEGNPIDNDYVIVNVSLQETVTKIQKIISGERMRRVRQVGLKGFVKELIKEAEEGA